MSLMISKNNKVSLIVNADDLGRSEKINTGIEDAFRNGIVSSTSLVANSPAFLHALPIVHRNPALGVGVHLAITEYPPLTDSNFLRELALKNMFGSFSFLLYARNSQIQCIKEEFRSQIDKVIAAGIVPTHLDGHCHCHVHPRLFNIVLELAGEYSIKWIRMPKESFIVFANASRYIQKITLFAACCLDKLSMKDRVSCAQHFYGFSEGGNLNQHNLRICLKRLRHGLNELMCHVGCENDHSSSSAGYRWADELSAMKAFSKDELKKSMGICIISYREAAA